MTADKLDAAIRDIINCYTRFDLPRYWSSGKAAAADGTLINISNNNVVSAYHIRYGAYGGIPYHHIGDNYTLLFSHFISVGVWKAIYIIDRSIHNNSEIQPEILYADTQAGPCRLLGLMNLGYLKRIPYHEFLSLRKLGLSNAFMPVNKICHVRGVSE